jgi:hypothetical protein
MTKIAKIPPSQKIPLYVLYFISAFALAYASILLTGFSFGINNNVFHIPYVLNLVNTKEFLDDAFYHSLEHFTSVVWPVIRLLSNECNVSDVFYVANLLSRAAALAAIAFLARTTNTTKGMGLAIFMAGIVLTPWLQEVSVVGGHGMFIGYFTHSETTWPFVFVAIALLSQNRLMASAAAAGAAFSINAFVGIWLFLAGAITIVISRQRVNTVLVAKSLAVFFLCASPSVIWIAATLGNTDTVSYFSYIEYIRAYYPGHFLIEASTKGSLVLFVLIVSAGLLAAQQLDKKTFWTSIQIAFVLIFVVGIPLPYIIDNRFVFNLHLLRSAGVEQAIAIVLALLAGLRMLTMTSNRNVQLLGLVVVFSLTALEKNILAIILVVASLSLVLIIESNIKARHFGHLQLLIKQHEKRLAFFIVGLFFLALASRVVHQYFGLSQTALTLIIIGSFLIVSFKGGNDDRLAGGVFLVFFFAFIAKTIILHGANAKNDRAYNSWLQMVNWVRASEIHGPFLLPLNDGNSNQFQLEARRKVWVDWKQGAAVMWLPSFYNQWMSRFSQVKELNTPEEFVNYAESHGIKNIILKTTVATCPTPSFLIKATEHYVLCQLK